MKLAEINEDCQIKGLKEIYEKYLPKKGIFVEIGAYDGLLHSNTLCLAKAGWKGYMVEPVKEHYEKLIENMKPYNVDCFHQAISDYNGLGTIKVRGELSSINRSYDDILDSLHYAKPVDYEEAVEVTTWLQFLNRCHVPANFDAFIDLLVIDTEGSELSILENIPFHSSLADPGMIIIELHDSSEMWNRHEQVRDDVQAIKNILDPHYRVIYSDDINTIYISKERYGQKA